MSELVINISNIISPLCYSVLRIEPYSSCSFRCIYCYARWYREGNAIKPRFNSLISFRTVARKIKERKLRIIPFRLATLSDPFQPLELKVKMSRSILKIALNNNIPLIINTKSDLILHEEISKLILKLNDKNLILLQISISTLDDEKAKILEPHAPSPSKRLDVVEFFSKENVPVAIRFQPFIPGVSDYPNLDHIISRFKSAGAQHLIVESIRLTRREIREWESNLNIKLENWEPYQLSIPSGLEDLALYRLSYTLREKLFNILMSITKKYGLTFATCKEGYFHLHTSSDCCGIYLLNQEKCILRPTLNEVYKLVKKHGPLSIEDIVNYLNEMDLLLGDKLNPYPKRIKKPLRSHEKKFIAILKNNRILSHITPSLTYIDGLIRLKHSSY